MIQNKMDFSMYKNRFFIYSLLALMISGCGGNRTVYDGDWYGTYDETTVVDMPDQIRHVNTYGTNMDTTHNIAVLLPLTGDNRSIGDTIRTSVEIATLQNAPHGLSVSFYDTATDTESAITYALSTNPSAIIGPVFSSDVQKLRHHNDTQIPTLSFTSDANALGNGIMTMALMPTNSVESIVKEMKIDDIKKFIIIAPDTESGHIMAGIARQSAQTYELPLIGIFFYTEQDSESIKNTAIDASMNTARTMAHTRARQVISDILTGENLNIIEQSNLNTQLEKLSKTETLGAVPYDGILFLGNGADTKNIVSFLRYYNVGANDARFYGTPMWNGSDITSDFTMSGAKYADMPQSDVTFTNTFEQISGTTPSRLSSFGYDATNMAISMLYSNKHIPEYLFNKNGYIGTDGIFRITPYGETERGLRIMQLNGSGTAVEIKPAPTSFIVPPYTVYSDIISPSSNMEMESDGIDPDDYIRLPERLREKYNSKPIGANAKKKITPLTKNVTKVDTTSVTENITPTEFESAKPEAITRTLIDEYEINE